MKERLRVIILGPSRRKTALAELLVELLTERGIHTELFNDDQARNDLASTSETALRQALLDAIEVAITVMQTSRFEEETCSAEE